MSEPRKPKRSGGTILGRTTEADNGPLDQGADGDAAPEGPAGSGPAGSGSAGSGSAGPAPSGPSPGPGSRPRPRWPLVACAVMAAAAVAVALFAVQQRNALQADRTLNRELRDVSGRTVAALTNYDYQHLDDWHRAVLANLTGSFQNTYQSSLQGYEQVYVAEHNRGTSTIEGVWVGQPNGGQATSVVLVRITVTSLTGTHTIEPYVQLTLLKVGGRWRVDDVQYTIESAAGGGQTTPAPTAPTTTVP